MNSYKLNLMEETLNKIHPKQIISTIGSFKICMFKVRYEYLTTRNNKKEGEKYFLLDTLNPQSDLKIELNKWVELYNDENKHRQISNVKFLESQCLSYLNI